MKKKGIIGVILFVLMSAGLCVWFIFSQKNTIYVTEGTILYYSGTNGHGSVEFEGEIPSLDGNEKYRELVENPEIDSQAFVDSLSCQWQNKDGSELIQGTIKNDDVIVYACRYDVEQGKKIGYRFGNLKTKYRVAGLPDVVEVDFFEGIEVGWDFVNGGMAVGVKVIDENAPAQLLQPVYEVSMDDQGMAVVTVTSPSEEALLEAGYDAKDHAYTRTFDVGSKPERIVDLNDASAIDAAYQATLPLIERAVGNCGSMLNSQGTMFQITGYEYLRLERAYGDSLDIIYNVYATGRTLIRGYSVDVFRFSDGSYHAYTSETEETTSCEITPYYIYWMK